jgi:hypothetical protein
MFVRANFQDNDAADEVGHDLPKAEAGARARGGDQPRKPGPVGADDLVAGSGREEAVYVSMASLSGA